ncbi:hypothetical protein BK133_08735 [Paenibacillus sp. FSL H8-0548]|uniref:DUF4184 family protein n=1 Tax=Paenibacillus sp. FSL H8-0548 TaxID=1920422 RepID=UPI00096C3BFF|nr:DUF4184 family protein [Paenibacillus sp. FSL H8-0548]OMF36720.1 hypothetical protein BK133_08735 [Paenibacillus sp. FSL H8-0548]
MPHTFAHPLFAAPLKKIIPSLSLTGLILGSMSPDFEYFVSMQPFRSIGHSVLGLLLLVLPACIAFSLVFHRIVKPALPELLPDIGSMKPYAAYLNRPWSLATWQEWMRFILSVIIGFLTHVFVDHFTHSSGWFVQRIPFLQKIIIGDELYHILQHFLTLSGFAAAGIYGLNHYFAWKKKQRKQSSGIRMHSSSRKLWGLLFFAALAMFLGKLLFSDHIFSISIWAVAPITSVLFGVYLAAMLHSAKKAHQTKRAVLILFVLVLFIVVYKLWSLHSEFSIAIWVVYNGVLAIILSVSAFLVRKNDSPFKLM